jgi:hypothetical protein
MLVNLHLPNTTSNLLILLSHLHELPISLYSYFYKLFRSPLEYRLTDLRRFTSRKLFCLQFFFISKHFIHVENFYCTP